MRCSWFSASCWAKCVVVAWPSCSWSSAFRTSIADGALTGAVRICEAFYSPKSACGTRSWLDTGLGTVVAYRAPS
ncbi:hypothetical protein PF005_g16504 [Phytophthora fragariae]|uniref:Secreted protein n=1 Tax=Phytophthora fragariae TaxID=53985 RepID=A0A6A3X7Y6_9STRA|nr:hypothetical protein PF003_g37578 [Phytophthora fragariae]KAE8932232.1 hypothetical protein PF009_g17726 [Phytophthora fragariae]KAE9078253.1 hypothetical protein PF007_g23937 [Phytophthora fragariae]KAE9132426.1 hypothetical protein PF006_g15286 [Phytophthora fragariae]KAE9197453.1 hypothetical protein PF005_g16504 [Phytophthora fragariae]